MPKIIGRRVSVGFAKETVRGTAEAAATFYVPMLARSWDDKIEQAIDESNRAVIEDSVDAKIVKKISEGEFEANIGDKTIGLHLLSLFGAVTSAVKETTAYNHTYAVAQTAQHQALSIFIDDPATQDYKHALGMVGSVEISAELGKFVSYKMAVKAKAGTTATLTPSYTTENNFLAQHIVCKIADTLAGLDAASVISIKKVSLKLDQSIEDDDILGSISPADILNKEFKIEGDLELVFDAETFKTLMLADTQKALRLDILNIDVTIGASSNPELKIDLAKVKFSEVARKIDNKDIVTQTVKFKSFYSVSDAKMLVCILTNSVTSY